MKENKQPFVKWYCSDFLAGVRGLSASQIGIYTILINEMYERCSPLPFNYKRLAWQCGCTQPFLKKTLEMLFDEEKLYVKDSGIWNGRVEKEFVDRQKRSDTGTNNANTRWKKANENKGTVMPKPCKTDATAMLNQKPEPYIKDIDKSISQKTDLFEDPKPVKKLNGKKKNDKTKQKQRIDVRFPTDQDFPECPEKYISWAKSKGISNWEPAWQNFYNYWFNQQKGHISWYRCWQNRIGDLVKYGNGSLSNRTGRGNGDAEGTITQGVNLALDRLGGRDEEPF